MTEPESGYIEQADASDFAGGAMTDVEVIATSAINVLARGRRYGRRWLLKGLATDMRDYESIRRRLLKEFEIHSRLTHPGIVQAIGLEETAGLGLCIVEEWIEGKTLSALLREGCLSKADRKRIMRGVTEAVGYLHSKGVTHRDLKPSNIMIRDAGGDPVIIDFGLADSDDYLELKQPAGTEGYISPEQMQAGGTNTTDDVYSLGVIMRELCPEYRALANRCTGPADRRPKDARELLKAIDRRDRKKKRVAVAILATFITILVAFGAFRIRSLSEASIEAEKKVAAISKENRRNAELVDNLTDSLIKVSQRMNDAETELRLAEEYEREINNVYSESHRRIDAILIKYDRNVFSEFTPDNNDNYANAWNRMNNELFQFADSFSDSAAASALTVTDREKLRLDMIQYYNVKVSKYQDKWIKRIYPTYQPGN